MGGSPITNKLKPNKLQVGSCGDTHLSNNVKYYITQSPPCANQDIPSETPPVDAQNIKKTCQMDSKSCCFPQYHHTNSSYSETIDTGSKKMHTPNKELVLILAWFMSPYNSTISQIHKWNQSQIPWWKHSPSKSLCFLETSIFTCRGTSCPPVWYSCIRVATLHRKTLWWRMYSLIQW